MFTKSKREVHAAVLNRCLHGALICATQTGDSEPVKSGNRLLVLITALLLGACGPPEQRTSDYLLKAQKFYAAGNYAKAADRGAERGADRTQ